jgi:hypothetical protein
MNELASTSQDNAASPFARQRGVSAQFCAMRSTRGSAFVSPAIGPGLLSMEASGGYLRPRAAAGGRLVFARVVAPVRTPI